MIDLSTFINQFKLVLRRLKRSPFYALVNVLGLTVGLIAVLFIGIYVYDELSYDRFHGPVLVSHCWSVAESIKGEPG